MLMNYYIDKKIWESGITRLAGVDEAGRGPLAGPVVACAVVLPRNFYHSEIDDSKKLREKKREELFSFITNNCLCYGIGIVDEKEIDRLNILQASLKAMKIAVERLPELPDRIIIDGSQLPDVLPKPFAVNGGDSTSITIAAASIVAKVTRDNIMRKYHARYPDYGFDRHKGYGTHYHIERIMKNGISPIHRLSFCKNYIIEDGKKGIGKHGEDIVCNYLIKKGYKIMRRNFRSDRGEIDIIAEDRSDLVFVEVKTNKKGGFGEPEYRVTVKKQKQLCKTAGLYLHENKTKNKDCRFDVIAVKLEPDGFAKINHIKDAFREPEE